MLAMLSQAVTMGDFTVFVQPHRTILNTNGWKQYKKDDEESALADWIENKTAGARPAPSPRLALCSAHS